MDVKDILHDLRVKKGLSQSELAEKVFVSRQAVSRWENGETTPNPETLKRLSGIFDVSINTLPGSPRQLVCQCCGMPLEDATTSHTTSYHFIPLQEGMKTPIFPHENPEKICRISCIFPRAEYNVKLR